MRSFDWNRPTLLRELADVVSQRFAGTPVAVVGDLMVDEFVTGSVERLSPEAPIPIMHRCNYVRVPGGAANVAMNLKSLGADVRVAGVVGDDDAGEWLRHHLEANAIDVGGVFVDGDRPTTLKTRYRTDQQQILRVDRESTHPLAQHLAQDLLDWFARETQACVHAILSDYRKGVLSGPGFPAALVGSVASGVEMGVDTKTRQPETFDGSAYFKPNQRELEAAVGGSALEGSIEEQAQWYLARTSANAVVVTRGDRGMLVVEAGCEALVIPTLPTQVFDVTGAGDTVMATIAMGRASGLSFAEASVLGNINAGVVVRKSGTGCASCAELLQELAQLAGTEVEAV